MVERFGDDAICIHCDCSDCHLHIDRDTLNKEFIVNWCFASVHDLSLMKRIRFAWSILVRGKADVVDLVLNPDGIRKVRDFMSKTLEMAEEKTHIQYANSGCMQCAEPWPCPTSIAQEALKLVNNDSQG